MKLPIFPTAEELEKHKQIIPEIDPPAVLAMLEIMETAGLIRSSVHDILEDRYQLSEGKLRVMILLHQHPEGLASSALAHRAGVTKATISGITHRMCRDGLAEALPDPADKRARVWVLTAQGAAFLHRILPDHYLRVSRMLSAITKEEQQELIHLLQKLISSGY